MAMERARATERERAIHEFRQSAASSARASILHHCPSLDTLTNDFLRTPDLEFAPSVSVQCENVKCQTSVWHWILLTEAGCRLYPRAEQCRMASECLCGAGGRKLRSFCNALIKSQRNGGFQKPTLKKGSVILALPPRNLPRTCGGLAASDCAQPDFDEKTEAVTWLHIGLMNFGPYKPSFQILKLSTQPSAVSNFANIWIACGLVVCTHFGPANTRSQKCNRAKCVTQASRSQCCFGQWEAHAES